ncbi:hypothetical protein WT14_26865 [Burkholderia stagnalis]|nr:hypothetical protein WT07_02920 [Burkholderia stagnalis]KVN56484.1 hypothetical protein WT14_26865 [Burkholderia stagnalis]KWD93092.1 hypothetical protein WT47_32475 [Burkholderia stagnalis]KWE22235.1 hypothetical protein WT48_06495 [Burkholderia stagnalis]KWO86611.1 hypothetical protein WU00_27025 [Burkholderia stagnalis]
MLGVDFVAKSLDRLADRVGNDRAFLNVDRAAFRSALSDSDCGTVTARRGRESFRAAVGYLYQNEIFRAPVRR